MEIVTGERGDRLHNEYQAYLTELARLNDLIAHARGKKRDALYEQKAALIEPKPVYLAADLVERAIKAIKRQVEFLETELQAYVSKMPTNQELNPYLESRLISMVNYAAELRVYQIALIALTEKEWRAAIGYIKRYAERQTANLIDRSHNDDARRLIDGAYLRNFAAVLFDGNLPMQLKLLLDIEQMDVYVYEPTA